LILREPAEIRGDSVNALALQLADFFMRSLGDERVEAAWPCVFDGPAELVGLGRRLGGVEKAFHDILRKRFSRVAKLATPERPRGVTPARGLFVWFADFGCAFAAREVWLNGQRRMADDAAAPSRSYLKVEEAYIVLGREPAPGETVADLGAAPGGWSFSAAKHGARVVAIDNGPLKGGALDHPLIEHRREDAFRFQPAEDAIDTNDPSCLDQTHGRDARATWHGRPAHVGSNPNAKVCWHYDWLFCDMLEDPHHVLHQIVEPWLARRWCRRFVINLKFGRVDPLALLAELRAPASPFVAHATNVRIRHLYHDREEFTVVGEVAAG
jgi:23S rRNA (cytidine2498-2'-O)-methyltransferase